MSEAFTIQADAGKSSKSPAGWRDCKLGAAVGEAGRRKGVPGGAVAACSGRGAAHPADPPPNGRGGRRGACEAQDVPPTHAAGSAQMATEQRNATREEKIPRLYLTGATEAAAARRGYYDKRTGNIYDCKP